MNKTKFDYKYYYEYFFTSTWGLVEYRPEDDWYYYFVDGKAIPIEATEEEKEYARNKYIELSTKGNN